LLELPEERIDDVIAMEDLLTACNSDVLTPQRRKTTFKQDFHNIEPVPIF